MILQGYFDESERDEGHAPICVAGYLFKPIGYRKFRWRWRPALRIGQHRFDHFHMTDLYAGKGQYEGLSIPDRVTILDRAVDALVPHFYAGVGVHFDRAEFEAEGPSNWPRYFGSIYSVACQMCLQSTSFMLDKLQSRLPVLYVFERGHKYRAEADALLTHIGDNAERRREHRYRNHMFEDKKREYGLQAADLMVWTITKARLNTGQPTPKSMKPFIPALWRLAQTNKDRQVIHSFTGDLLRKFIEHQLRELQTRGPQVVHVGPRKRAFR